MTTESPAGGKLRRVLAASLIGNALEWYDYLIYGTAAALVFPQLFFPESSELAGMLASFATFAAGFVVRPIGGAIAGHYGDRIGRKRMLIATLLVMGLSSFAIGLLPTYASLGAAAAVPLVLLRLLQGIAIGGEWSGAILLAIEQTSDRKKNGFRGSFPQMGNAVGLLVATGVFAAASSLPDDLFLSWGWRIPFLLSIVLVAIGLVLRTSIPETPEFRRLLDSQHRERRPLVAVLRSHPRNFLFAAGSRLGVDVSFYVFTVYSLSYAQTALDVPKNVGLFGLMAGAALAIFTMPLAGAIADRVGIRRTYVSGLVFLGLFASPFFLLLDTGQPLLVWLALTVAYAVGIAWAWGPYAGFLTGLFPVNLGYSGTALSFQIAGIFGGAIAPYIATLLQSAAGSAHAVAAYMMAMVAVSVVCALLAKNVEPASNSRSSEGKFSDHE